MESRDFLSHKIRNSHSRKRLDTRLDTIDLKSINGFLESLSTRIDSTWTALPHMLSINYVFGATTDQRWFVSTDTCYSTFELNPSMKHSLMSAKHVHLFCFYLPLYQPKMSLRWLFSCHLFWSNLKFPNGIFLMTCLVHISGWFRMSFYIYCSQLPNIS